MATGNLRQVLDLVGVAEKARGTSGIGGAAATVASAVASSAVGTEPTTSTPTKGSPQPR